MVAVFLLPRQQNDPTCAVINDEREARRRLAKRRHWLVLPSQTTSANAVVRPRRRRRLLLRIGCGACEISCGGLADAAASLEPTSPAAASGERNGSTTNRKRKDTAVAVAVAAAASGSVASSTDGRSNIWRAGRRVRGGGLLDAWI
uniref:Uncharacterized protein n=1 Tax=Setaria viridis TaxID=4556 RepID=A0A4U6WAN4_SETVI|nr:hypothetical protein SEVIR_1G142401v2 [Setaria viridis]